MRILVAEDDAPLAEFLRQRLLQEHFAVQMVTNGAEAQRMASDQSYDLVVLDLNRNGAAGLEVLRGIRSKKPDQPVLMMAGANVVEDRVRGLNAGADDFVGKPFEVAELAARIRAVVRRGNRPGRNVLQVGDLELDRITHTVQRHGHAIDLKPQGICAAGIPDEACGATGLASGNRGAGVEAELRHHDECCGRVH